MKHRWLKLGHILALTLALAGCGGGGYLERLPPAPGIAGLEATPHLTATDFRADDGARLPLRIWRPEGKVRATILALHGFDDYSNAFAGAAAEWARHGIATYAYDQRGFGAAPDRGYWAGTYRLDQDAAIASRLVAAHNPGVPHYLLGESMGGAVAITAVTGAAGAERPVADGVILVAPAVWGRVTMNVFERVALWVGDRVAPGLALTGQGLHIMASDNIAMLRALGRDPLVIKATRIETIYGLVDLMDRALAAAPRLKERMLLLYGEHDELIPRDAVETMIDNLPPRAAVRQRIAWYPQGYHMLLRDLDGLVVQRDIESWIFDPAAPLPSGADHNAYLLTAHE